MTRIPGVSYPYHGNSYGGNSYQEERLKVCILYPPCTDPTMPYLALASLNAAFKAGGWETQIIDANAQGWRSLLTGDGVLSLVEKASVRCKALQQKSILGHEETGELIGLQDSLLQAPSSAALEDAVKVFCDVVRFYDQAQYGRACETMEAFFSLLSAVYYPLDISFAAFKDKFSLLDRYEIDRARMPERMPFFWFFVELSKKVAEGKPDLIAVSTVYTSQIQCALSLGTELRKLLPDTRMVLGGPAVTQIAERCFRGAYVASELEDFLSPFDCLVAGEAEPIIGRFSSDVPMEKIIFVPPSDDFKSLTPDYAGIDLSVYFAPSPVLSFDAARGCYWGQCAFCQYGLSGCGTAGYRERDSEQSAAAMKVLSDGGAEVVFLSEDTLSPDGALALAKALGTQNIKWATDIRPEAGLTEEVCKQLKAGGALCLTIGAESANQRVLKLMGKGTRASTVEDVIRNAGNAGMACEGMYFLDFPTETSEEALETLQSIINLKDSLSLFICGEFEMVPGCAAALDPEKFEIEEVYTVAGDTWRLGCFYIPGYPTKVRVERREANKKLEEASEHFTLRSYPWAGSLSTAHSFLYYKKFGAGVFRGQRTVIPPYEGALVSGIESLPDQVSLAFRDYEEKIWEEMISEFREVSRELYEHLMGGLKYKFR